MTACDEQNNLVLPKFFRGLLQCTPIANCKQRRRCCCSGVEHERELGGGSSQFWRVKMSKIQTSKLNAVSISITETGSKIWLRYRVCKVTQSGNTTPNFSFVCIVMNFFFKKFAYWRQFRWTNFLRGWQSHPPPPPIVVQHAIPSQFHRLPMTAIAAWPREPPTPNSSLKIL